MRRIIHLCLFICIYANGQTYTNDEGVFHYRDVVEVDSMDIKETISKWIAVNFVNSNHVTRLNDGENIIVKGAFDINTSGIVENIDFTMDVAIKEGKYKLEFYNLSKVDNYIGIKLPIIDPDRYTKEYHRDISTAIINGMGFGKKAALKRMENETTFNKDYERSKGYVIRNFEKVKTYFDAIAYDIKNEFTKNKANGW